MRAVSHTPDIAPKLAQDGSSNTASRCTKITKPQHCPTYPQEGPGPDSPNIAPKTASFTMGPTSTASFRARCERPSPRRRSDSRPESQKPLKLPEPCQGNCSYIENHQRFGWNYYRDLGTIRLTAMDLASVSPAVIFVSLRSATTCLKGTDLGD